MVVEDEEAGVFGRVDDLGANLAAAGVKIVEGDFGDCSGRH